MPEQTIVSKPSLYGGVSKQPVHLRHPSQVADALNADFSPAYGVFTRSGTKLVSYLGTCRFSISGKSGTWTPGQEVVRTSGSPSFGGTIVSVSEGGSHITVRVTSGTFTAGVGVTAVDNGAGAGTGTIATVWSQWTSGTRVRIEPIYRSASEIYLLVQGPSDYPRVIPIGPTLGKEAELVDGSGSHAVRTYLQSGSPTAADYRYTTIGDVTYLASTKVRMGGVNWASTVSAGVEQGTVSATLMPQKMTRTSTSPLSFTFAAEAWQSRYINSPATARGNSSNNPLPALIGGFPYQTSIGVASTGEFISDIGTFKSRLYIVGGPYVLFSQINDYVDFWIDDPSNNVVDSDPIQLRLADNNIASGDRATSLRNSLIVSAAGGLQFEISSTSDTFSPSSASSRSSTTINSIPALTMPRFQTGLLIGSRSGNNGNLHFYAYDDVQIAYTTVPLSSHVEGLIPANATKLVADTNNGFAAMLTSNSTRNVYVMRMAYVDGKLAQTAWGVWQVSNANDTINDIAIVNGVLYIVLETSNGYVVEGVALSSPMNNATTLLATGAAYDNTGSSGQPNA